jgi:hypothetical protein
MTEHTGEAGPHIVLAASAACGVAVSSCRRARRGQTVGSVPTGPLCVAFVQECLSVQPFDMVKTRFQLSASNNPSVLGGLRALITEGGFLRMYRSATALKSTPAPRS